MENYAGAMSSASSNLKYVSSEEVPSFENEPKDYVSNLSKNDILQKMVAEAKNRNTSAVRELMNTYYEKSPNKPEAIKEILIAAIQSGNSNVLSVFARNGASPKEIEGENLKAVLVESINSKNMGMVGNLLSEINGYYGNGKISYKLDSNQLKEVLTKAFDTKQADIASRITREVDFSKLDKEYLKDLVNKAMIFENRNVLYTVLQKAGKDNVKLGTETYEMLLDNAIKNSDRNLMGYVLNYGDLDKSKFSKVVEYAIQKEDLQLLTALVDKDSLNKADFKKVFTKVATCPEYDLDNVDNDHYGLFIKLTEKADLNTYKELILDEKIGDKINNVIFTSVMSRDLKTRKITTDEEKKLTRSIVTELRNAEMKINDREVAKDTPNLVDQILSQADNRSLLIEFQELVFQSYKDVVKEGLEKNPELKGKFPVEKFEKSINRSKDFIRNPEGFKLQNLTTDMADFMVIPLYVPGHHFTGFIRKLEDGNYSMTAVNLGARPFEAGSHSYMEFVYDKPQNLQKIIDKYTIPDFKGETNITSCYREFKANAKEFFTLKTDSRLQKTGNCFTKNTEKSIRYGISLIMEKIKNPEFKQENIRTTPGFRPTHYKELVGGKIRINEIIVERLSKLFPEKKEQFEKSLNKYENNKRARQAEEERKRKGEKKDDNKGKEDDNGRGNDNGWDNDPDYFDYFDSKKSASKASESILAPKKEASKSSLEMVM